MRAAKLVLNVKHLTYKERLVQLKLPTLKYKFWSNQDLLYNYKAELTGIGNRSFINNLIINEQFVQIMLCVIWRA